MLGVCKITMGFVILLIINIAESRYMSIGYINQFHNLSEDGGLSQFMQTIDDGTLGPD